MVSIAARCHEATNHIGMGFTHAYYIMTGQDLGLAK